MYKGKAENHPICCVGVIRNISVKVLQSFKKISLLFIFKRTIVHIFSSDCVHTTALMQLLMVLKEIAATFLKRFVADVVKVPSHTIKPHYHLLKYFPFSFQTNGIKYLSAGSRADEPCSVGGYRWCEEVGSRL